MSIGIKVMLLEIIKRLQNGNGKMNCLQKVQEFMDLRFVGENGRKGRDSEEI
jgi:hypothetical protein